MSRSTLLALLAALLLSACGMHGTRPGTAASSTEPAAATSPSDTAANDNLNAVAWLQTSAEHDLIFRQTYRSATLELDRALADPQWEALAAGERKTPVTDPARTAIIVDIDETVLDNGPYQARQVVDNTLYNKASWAEWCREAQAKALPGALEFTRRAAARGVTVFYLSNRAHELSEATLANLKKLDFPLAAGEEVFLGLGLEVPGCVPKNHDKGCRRELVSRKYRVIMQFGDQLGDFLDVAANTPEARRQIVAPYLDWVGERWFVLPNPTYGNWEPALFGNDWSLPIGEQRKAKRNALDTAR
jgi:acid phosphatase